MLFVSKSRPNDNSLPPYEVFEFVLFKDIVVAYIFMSCRLDILIVIFYLIFSTKYYLLIAIDNLKIILTKFV